LRHDSLFTISDEAVFYSFLNKFGINPLLDSFSAIDAVSAAFSHLPYENLTKIYKTDAVLTSKSAKRVPDEVLSDYLNFGTGGTCFSLTASLVALLRRFKVESFPILADRRYGADTHCGVMIIMNNSFFLLDPGYQIFEPRLLPVEEPFLYSSKFNNIRLIPKEMGKKVELFTEIGNDKKYRLTYKINPLESDDFGVAWERSFGWEMMNYPVLTKIIGNSQHYFQGDLLTIKKDGKNEKMKLDRESGFCYIVNTLGISPEIAKKALEVIYGSNN